MTLLRAATLAEQAEAANVLDSLISLALLASPVDVDALSYIRKTVGVFEVRGIPRASYILHPSAHCITVKQEHNRKHRKLLRRSLELLPSA